MTKKEAWKIFNESPYPERVWENEAEHTGLLLAICSKCGEKQTPETYLNFWTDFYTLIQDYSVTAIARHKCGQWHKYVV